MSLKKDLEEAYEFYMRSFMEMIGDQHKHIPKSELEIIWKNIKKPARNKKQKKEKNVVVVRVAEEHVAGANDTNTLDIQTQQRNKMEISLNNMRPDDLYRHCIRNGIHPPNNKNDMIKVILTRSGL